MSDEAKAVRETAIEKKTPQLASAEMLAEARAISRNLTWDDLVRIASKPKHAGWIVWKESGTVEQITLVPSNAWIVIARAWKTGTRHPIVYRPSETEYKCVELDPVTKRPISVPA